MLEAVCGVSPKPQNVAGAGRTPRQRSMRREKVQHRSDTPPFREMKPMSKATVAPLAKHRRQTHSLRKGSVLAALLSSTSTRTPPISAPEPYGARNEAHQTADHQRSRISTSTHGGPGLD